MSLQYRIERFNIHLSLRYPTTKNLSAEKKLEEAEARIKYLEAELELLKKLEELERQAKKKQF